MLRIIARLNLGGPAKHVAILTERLDPDRYSTLLVHGTVGEGEAEMRPPRVGGSAAIRFLPMLSPALRPLADLRALIALIRIAREFRPEIVHTHTAKAGFLGRLAALTVRPRPLIVHTYHGHVLEGYFGRARTALYRVLERLLARVSDALIGVSAATVDDLVRLGVAPRERFRVVRLGLDLEPLARLGPEPGTRLRKRLGLGRDDVLAVFAGRLVQIKRVDVLLRAVAIARGGSARLQLALVGDGPLREPLGRLARELGIGDAVHFLGYRSDLAAPLAAAELAVLTSDNEGTPVWLIEAAAAGRPAVATDVGGVRDVVGGEMGLLAPPGDCVAIAHALSELVDDPARRVAMGRTARRHVMERYSAARLVSDVERLYESLARSRAGTFNFGG